jgi:3-hydroxybutyryl-CoA dehydrogenase
MTNPFKTIGVIGAGTMGAGIAQVAAQKGFEVILYDIQQNFVDAGLNRIQAFLNDGLKRGKITEEEIQAVEGGLKTTTELNNVAQADLVIEAAPEDMELKKKLFAELDGAAPAHTLLASNTSSLSITAMASATKRPSQVAGLHFFNPVPLMKLIEVIRGQRTSDETMERLIEFSKALGKSPVRAKDTPGFIVNRVARPFYGEAFKILGEGAASIETLDVVMKQVGGFRMGPFELMDLIGIDVNFAVTQSVYNATFQESRYKPHPIQQKMVEAGLLGRKTGEGFYQYE